MVEKSSGSMIFDDERGKYRGFSNEEYWIFVGSSVEKLAIIYG